MKAQQTKETQNSQKKNDGQANMPSHSKTQQPEALKKPIASKDKHREKIKID